MKNKLLALTFTISISIGATVHADKTPVEWVNPFIGTGAVANSLSGNNYPGATVPFGMVQLSPDTRVAPDWAQASGYDYNDRQIIGFSHTRLSGTGASDFIDILLMPTTGKTCIEAQESPRSGTGYQSAFSHDRESASPGYYKVTLDSYGIDAELTASARVGMHRYRYPQGADSSHIVLDLDHSANKGSWGRRIINSQIRIVDPCTVDGYRIITGWAKLRKIYFRIRFSQPIKNVLLADGSRIYHNMPVINGTALKAVFDFDTRHNTTVMTKVALSPVSIENAIQNMSAEIPGWDFDDVVRQASGMWNAELGKIQVQGTDLQKEIFYTALYHTMIQPNIMSDANGDYMAADYTVRRLSGNDKHYSTFSLWDTYRAAHPLYTLIHPDRSAHFIKSMIRQYDYYGYLPVWQLWGQDNYCMIGNHAIPVIVDAIQKGIPGIDMEKAYEAVRKSSLISHPNSPFDVWDKYGYMPENIQSQSVSITLEFSFDDWCVARLAKKLGKEDDCRYFAGRSENYRNLFNPETRFFQPKDDKGNWITPFDPYKYGANGGYPFTEGNAWQYFWYVPHNIKSLVRLTGGDKAFAEKLDHFFTSTHTSGEKNDNASGFIGQYAHGNEPSHHVAYLYNYVGQPWKTQQYVSYILNNLYDNTSAGYAGNDDCGEMSSWYIFSAMGFYPVNPASGIYVIGSPLLEQADIHLPGGNTFTVKAPKKNDKEIYIQSVRLNGKKYDKTYITHQDILQGGTLEFKMGVKPSSWGKKPEMRPVEEPLM